MSRNKELWPKPELKANPIPIKAKYAPETLIPSELIDGNHVAQKYKLVGGEVITLQYKGAYDNRNGYCLSYLEDICRELFDMNFAAVELAWKRRLGSISGWWQRVGMVLCE